nr:uncharacterized protein LOC120972797 [Aegilops tauschii subsp. strangulata]
MATRGVNFARREGAAPGGDGGHGARWPCRQAVARAGENEGGLWCVTRSGDRRSSRSGRNRGGERGGLRQQQAEGAEGPPTTSDAGASVRGRGPACDEHGAASAATATSVVWYTGQRGGEWRPGASPAAAGDWKWAQARGGGRGRRAAGRRGPAA